MSVKWTLHFWFCDIGQYNLLSLSFGLSGMSLVQLLLDGQLKLFSVSKLITVIFTIFSDYTKFIEFFSTLSFVCKICIICSSSFCLQKTLYNTIFLQNAVYITPPLSFQNAIYNIFFLQSILYNIPSRLFKIRCIRNFLVVLRQYTAIQFISTKQGKL